MKIVAMIARYLLGLMFFVFGLNSFLHFIPQGPEQPGNAGAFLGLLMAAHYFYAIGTVMVIAGVLLLANRYVALGLTLLGPVLVNILVFHILMAPSSIWLGMFATLLWFLVFWWHRAAFAGIFAAKVEG
jgi:putative oxidoreductase